MSFSEISDSFIFECCSGNFQKVLLRVLPEVPTEPEVLTEIVQKVFPRIVSKFCPDILPAVPPDNHSKCYPRNWNSSGILPEFLQVTPVYLPELSSTISSKKIPDFSNIARNFLKKFATRALQEIFWKIFVTLFRKSL